MIIAINGITGKVVRLLLNEQTTAERHEETGKCNGLDSVLNPARITPSQRIFVKSLQIKIKDLSAWLWNQMNLYLILIH